MAFQKQLIFFDGDIAQGSDDSIDSDIMISQVRGGASGLGIGLARPARLFGQVKETFASGTNVRFRAYYRNDQVAPAVNEVFADVTRTTAQLTKGAVFWNLVLPVPHGMISGQANQNIMHLIDRIRVNWDRSGTFSAGQVFIALIIGGQGLQPRTVPGGVAWDNTGLRIPVPAGEGLPI